MQFETVAFFVATLSLVACAPPAVRTDAAMDVQDAVDAAVSDSNPTDSPWTATWGADVTYRVFSASFRMQPDASMIWDQPNVDASAGEAIGNQPFTYSRDIGAANLNGAVTLRIDGDAVRIEAMANAQSPGVVGVDLHSGVGFDLCYRAPLSATTVQFVGDVAFTAPLDVSGANATAAYQFWMADIGCFGGIGELPADGGIMSLGNGLMHCVADVPVGADGLACLRGRTGFGVEANTTLLESGEGRSRVDAILTITAAVH